MKVWGKNDSIGMSRWPRRLHELENEHPEGQGLAGLSTGHLPSIPQTPAGALVLKEEFIASF